MTGTSPSLPMKGKPQPTRDDLLPSDRLTVLSHPLANALVTKLRDVTTSAGEFELAMHDLTRQLVWLATDREPRRGWAISGFDGNHIQGWELSNAIASLIILRAGLGMLPPLRRLLPEAPNYQLGIKRDEATLEPRLYYSNLPDDLDRFQHILLLDPMLATGGSACLAVQHLRAGFRGRITFLGMIGAPFGVQMLLKSDPQLRIFLAALDDRLNDHGYIMPGLGDAGDRLFGTN